MSEKLTEGSAKLLQQLVESGPIPLMRAPDQAGRQLRAAGLAEAVKMPTPFEGGHTKNIKVLHATQAGIDLLVHSQDPQDVGEGH